MTTDVKVNPFSGTDHSKVVPDASHKPLDLYGKKVGSPDIVASKPLPSIDLLGKKPPIVEISYKAQISDGKPVPGSDRWIVVHANPR